MKLYKNKYLQIESDGSLKFNTVLKSKLLNKLIIQEKDFKKFKNLKTRMKDKNYKSRYRKIFF